jgi:hypothetical protein
VQRPSQVVATAGESGELGRDAGIARIHDRGLRGCPDDIEVVGPHGHASEQDARGDTEGDEQGGCHDNDGGGRSAVVPSVIAATLAQRTREEPQAHGRRVKLDGRDRQRGPGPDRRRPSPRHGREQHRPVEEREPHVEVPEQHAHRERQRERRTCGRHEEDYSARPERRQPPPEQLRHGEEAEDRADRPEDEHHR